MSGGAPSGSSPAPSSSSPSPGPIRTVCVVGSGGREHALALALARTADVVVTPGNPGITGRSPEGHSLESVATAPDDEEVGFEVLSLIHI